MLELIIGIYAIIAQPKDTRSSVTVGEIIEYKGKFYKCVPRGNVINLTDRSIAIKFKNGGKFVYREV